MRKLANSTTLPSLVIPDYRGETTWEASLKQPEMGVPLSSWSLSDEGLTFPTRLLELETPLLIES